MNVTVWICPAFGCGNYYGASSAGNLREQTNQNAHDPFSRARCPNCWTSRGVEVERIPVRFEDGLDGARRAELDERQAATP